MWQLLSSLSEAAVLLKKGSILSLGQRRYFEIDAAIFDTSTQLESNCGVKIIIDDSRTQRTGKFWEVIS
jgi:hypothetical protein